MPKRPDPTQPLDKVLPGALAEIDDDGEWLTLRLPLQRPKLSKSGKSWMVCSLTPAIAGTLPDGSQLRILAKAFVVQPTPPAIGPAFDPAIDD